MRIGVIANPWAGRGRGRSYIAPLRTAARLFDIETEVRTTSARGDGVRLARELSGGVDAIAIVGGDGTVHEVINGLMPDPIPIIILPAGTGNDFASLFACPTRAEELFSMAREGVGSRVDVLSMGNRYCVNNAGLGFEGLVNRYSHRIQHVKGALVYPLAVLRALATLECPHFRITLSDGAVYEGNHLLVSVGNGNRAGGAFHLTPDACPDDGLIDVCMIEAIGRLRVLRLLPKSFNGTHVAHSRVRVVRAQSIVVESAFGHPMHVDGELIDPAPEHIEFTVLHRALPVLCGKQGGTALKHGVEKLL